MSNPTPQKIPRPPVVVVMGHIDHGKSTLLDYIRKTNIVEKEAGGITQHLSAYEVIHHDEHNTERKITFLDTPGHEAFSHMRERGAQTADIAILVVSAEDSVKAQTLEAWNTIIESNLPYIVAINKIDRPGANIEKTKMDLTEKGIYLEGYGGDIPFAEISAKQGTNIDTLLDLILLVADMHEFSGDPTLPASGVVIESRLDPKRGIAATLIIKNGTLSKGDFVVVETSLVGTRMVENFLGKPITEATFSSPIQIIGFDTQPQAGSTFESYNNKKEAEKAVALYHEMNRDIQKKAPETHGEEIAVIPLIIKTDVSGTLDAVEKEVRNLELDTVKFKIVQRGIGAISEADMKMASGDKKTILVGFNVGVDQRAREMNEKEQLPLETFTIIYKLSDYLREIVLERKPRNLVAEVSGSAKILKVFNETKNTQVIGGKVLSGMIVSGTEVRIMRRENEIGRGTISELQHNKLKIKQLEEGNEFGMSIEAKTTLAPGDEIEAFVMVEK